MQGVNPSLVQFLDISIRRSAVLEDALNQIVSRRHELRKPLRVAFVSEGVQEEGLDQACGPHLLFLLFFSPVPSVQAHSGRSHCLTVLRTPTNVAPANRQMQLYLAVEVL